ncbi:hypothetical protein F383_35088 [Gossypium arboreum]|uniref:Uncharacterized protein n=1 Tax=Gossypium arboreum TaxID=29729 RepID=A0A0B0PTL1_GOSAR|nr:hypothetical protein F383_35088 [Gossypium arboreum]
MKCEDLYVYGEYSAQAWHGFWKLATDSGFVSEVIHTSSTFGTLKVLF